MPMICRLNYLLQQPCTARGQYSTAIFNHGKRSRGVHQRLSGVADRSTSTFGSGRIATSLQVDPITGSGRCSMVAPERTVAPATDPVPNCQAAITGRQNRPITRSHTGRVISGHVSYDPPTSSRSQVMETPPATRVPSHGAPSASAARFDAGPPRPPDLRQGRRRGGQLRGGSHHPRSPNQQSPHKVRRVADLVSAGTERLALCRLATADDPLFAVDDRRAGSARSRATRSTPPGR